MAPFRFMIRVVVSGGWLLWWFGWLALVVVRVAGSCGVGFGSKGSVVGGKPNAWRKDGSSASGEVRSYHHI